jgi:hypothetical protein
MVHKPASRSTSRSPRPSQVGPRSPLYKGLVKATFSIRPEQLVALRKEARRRADAAGTYRADASEVVREAVDLWLRDRDQQPRGARQHRSRARGRAPRKGTGTGLQN